MGDKKCGRLVKIAGEHGPGRPCIRDAICHVTYFTDGSGGQYACAHHRDAAITEVASALTVGGRAVLKYTPLGAHAAKIERQYHKNRKATET